MLGVIFEKLDELTLERSQFFMMSRFVRAFIEADEVITKELIPYLEVAFCKKNFGVDTFKLYIQGLEGERLRLYTEMNERSGSPTSRPFYQPQIDLISEKLAVKNFEELIERINFEFNEYTGYLEILDNFYISVHGESGAIYISKNYRYFRIGELLYAAYCRNKVRLAVISQVSAHQVIAEYKRIDIDIVERDLQFAKYKLISLNEHVAIQNGKDSQTIVDDRIGKYFWVDVPRKLLLSFEEIIESQLVGNISFRVKGVTEVVPMMEEMEFGSKLTINVEELPELSKFYSRDNFHNKLWVTHNRSKNSITFEEHLEDFELIGDDVATQLVHLEYSTLKDKTCITHIDHEIIVYTLDQYIKRTEDHATKGYKKIKSFKIDDAKIPFDYKYNGECFLLLVLDAYFRNKDLINEYFNEIKSW